jgi:hypothetical protein
MAYDRTSMLSAASSEFKARQASPCPVTFYAPPPTLLKQNKSSTGGTFSRTAVTRSLASPLQCPEAFYEAGPGVGLGIPGSHGVIQRAERWVVPEDENSPGPIYLPSVDWVKPKPSGIAFSRADRFPQRRPELSRRGTPLSALPSASPSPALSTHASFKSWTSLGLNKEPITAQRTSPQRCTFGRRLPTRDGSSSEPRQRNRSQSPHEADGKVAGTGPNTQSKSGGGGGDSTLKPSHQSTSGDSNDLNKSSSMLHSTPQNDLETEFPFVQLVASSTHLLAGGSAHAHGGHRGKGSQRKGGKEKGVQKEVTPGPGHFLSSVFQSHAEKWTIGRRFRPNVSTTPGPGAYQPEKAFRSGKPKAATFARSGRPSTSLGMAGVDSPGPALYSRLDRVPVDKELQIG